LKVSDAIDIVGIVTRESVESLGLSVGKPAVALIKSSFVILAAGHDDLPISARNRIKGIISSILPGAVNDEITLDLGDEKTLTAIVTHESSDEMNLAVGQPAQALIKASHVILAVD
jgi:molybdate transport system regulatory protein